MGTCIGLVLQRGSTSGGLDIVGQNGKETDAAVLDR